MVANAAFLIVRTREAEFDSNVRKLDTEMGRRLLIKCVGPVAPYNFVNVSDAVETRCGTPRAGW